MLNVARDGGGGARRAGGGRAVATPVARLASRQFWRTRASPEPFYSPEIIAGHESDGETGRDEHFKRREDRMNTRPFIVVLVGALFVAALVTADRIKAQTAGAAANAEAPTTIITLGTRGGPLTDQGPRAVFKSSGHQRHALSH